jgi:PAS domain S-box-containing protein
MPSTKRATGLQVVRNGWTQMAQRNNPTGVDPESRPISLTSDPFGWWRYDVGKDTVTWSNSLFGLFGFAVHEVVPTLSLMSSHQHPQDQPSWDHQVGAALTTGTTVSMWHRIIDARRQERTLHTVLQAEVDDDGRVVQISGLMTDLTNRLQQGRSLAASEAVARSAQTRGVIDQAKGIIMATLDLEEVAAFDLLRWHSSNLNIKLREVAAAVVARRVELTEADRPSAPRERLTEIIKGLAAARIPALSAARSISDRALDVDVEQETARTGQISPGSLPRTMIRAVAAAAQSISIADYNAPDQPLVYVNRAFETLTGYPAQEILGLNCRFLQGAGADAEARSELHRAITAGEEIRTVLRNYRKDGTAFWNEVHLSAVRDATGLITHYVGYQSDVSERVQREQQLEHLAFHDARTNLPNEAAAAAHLQQLTSSPGTAQPTVAKVHLSGFRGTEDFDDPEIVRTVLAAAAQRLQAAFPPPAYLAKFDEDQFLVVLIGTSSFEAAARTLAEPIPLGVGEIRLTVRIELMGVDEVDHPGEIAEG